MRSLGYGGGTLKILVMQKEAQLEKETSEENASDEGGAPQAEDADESIETELMDVDWKVRSVALKHSFQHLPNSTFKYSGDRF